MIIWKSVANFI